MLTAALAVPATIAWGGSAATPSKTATTTAKTTAAKSATAKPAPKRAVKKPAQKLTRQQKLMAEGRKVYREYCGKCHALKAARATGFGGIGTEPGPSFDDVQVNYRRSINAIVESIGGHETISQKMTWKEIEDVSRYVAILTKKNPYPGTHVYG